MSRLKICLVDDHEIVRDGLKALFFGLPEIEVVGSFVNGKELFSFLKTKSVDLVLLDVSMPGLSGTEVAKILSVRYPAVKVIMLSAFDDKESVEASIKAGAAGFLTKETNINELRLAIEKTMDGKYYYGTGNIEIIFKNYLNSLAGSPPEINTGILSAREVEIVRLFSDGLLYKEVADLLQISIKTVESHKANIMRKLEIRSTAELVKYAIRKRIITL